MLIPKLNNRSKADMSLPQLETALDNLWQEKWRFRVNIVKIGGAILNLSKKKKLDLMQIIKNLKKQQKK